MSRAIGILDLGSNTMRLVVVSISPNGAFRVTDTAKAAVRLAAHVESDGTITREGFERTLSALGQFHALGRSHGVTEYLAVATATVRQATNGDAFVRELAARTGTEIRVITGTEESELSFLGAINTLAVTDGLLVDVGGASTELVRFADRRILTSVSLPYGTVNLTALFPPKSERAVAQMTAFVDELLSTTPWISGGKVLPIIGVGGTVRAIARLDRKVSAYPYNMLHNYRMRPGQVARACGRILKAKEEERSELPGIDADRAGVIAAGAVMVNQIMARTGARELLVSSAGLREGLLYRHLLTEHPEPRVGDVLGYSVTNLVRLLDLNETRSKAIASIALQLFDELSPIHRLGESPRRCLQAAAALADAGRVINQDARHQNTFILLTRSRLHGLAHREALVAGAAAGFEGRRKAKELLKPFASVLDPRDDELACQLGVLVALARMIAAAPSSLPLQVSHDKEEVRIGWGLHAPVSIWHEEGAEILADFRKAFGLRLSMLTLPESHVAPRTPQRHPDRWMQ